MNVTVGMRYEKHRKRSMMQGVDTSLATSPRVGDTVVLVRMPRKTKNVDDGNINDRLQVGGRRNIRRTAVSKCAVKSEPVRLVSRLQQVKIVSSTYFAEESSFSQRGKPKHSTAAFDCGAEPTSKDLDDGSKRECRVPPRCREALIHIIEVWRVVAWVLVHRWCRTVRAPCSWMLFL